MAKRDRVGDMFARILAKVGGNHYGNRHLSKREWSLLEAPRAKNPRRRQRSQWTEDNLK